MRAVRLKAGWSQEQVAGAVGIAPNSLSYYENGRKGLTITTLAGIAVALGVRLADLVDVSLPVPENTVAPADDDALVRAIRALPDDEAGQEWPLRPHRASWLAANLATGANLGAR